MKAEVLIAYTDRISGELRLPGQTVDETAGRISELEAGGYVKAKPAARRKAQAKDQKGA